MASLGGFFKGLGKGLLTAAPAIAAPFTGGASLATMLPAVLGGAGAVASGIAGGRGQGRQAEAQTQLPHDIARAQDERERLRRMVAADVLGAPQGERDPRDQFRGSFGSQEIAPETLARLRESANTPGISPLPQSGKTDTFLNLLGGLGQFAGALNVPPQQQPPQPIATMGKFLRPPSSQRAFSGVNF